MIAVELKNDLSELRRLHDWVKGYGAQSQLTTDVVWAVNLALEEIVANVIYYAFADEGEHAITVRFAQDRDVLTVEVEDGGVAYDPFQQTRQPVLDKPLAERPVGGLGVYFVQKLMDDVAYRRERDKNILTLKKRLTQLQP